VEYRIPRSNPAVRDRLEMVNGMLKNANGDRRLFIAPRCRELILDLEQVVLQEGSLIIDKTKDLRRTHLSDALGYLIWQERQPNQTVGPVNLPLLSI